MVDHGDLHGRAGWVAVQHEERVARRQDELRHVRDELHLPIADDVEPTQFRLSFILRPGAVM